MVSIFFKPFLKIREHLIKGWHFSFLPLLVLVIHFTWEVGCVFLIPSNSAARRLALRAHSRHHGNQRIAAMRSHALCVTTLWYCSQLPFGRGMSIFPQWRVDYCSTGHPAHHAWTAASPLDVLRFPCSDFRNGRFAPWCCCSAPSRLCSSETPQAIWIEPAVQKHHDHTRWGQRPP